MSCSERVQHFGKKYAFWTVISVNEGYKECVETKNSPDLDVGRRLELKSGLFSFLHPPIPFIHSKIGSE